MELLGNTVGTIHDSADLQNRRNLLSYHLAGGDKKPEFLANVAQVTQKTPVSGHQPFYFHHNMSQQLMHPYPSSY